MLNQDGTPQFVPGRVRDTQDLRDQPFTFSLDGAKPQPATISLVARMPDAIDQGQLGSCVMNATAMALLYRQIREGKPNPVLGSRLFGYLNGRLMEGTVNQDSGLQVRDGPKTVAAKGLPPESEWPYDIAKYRVIPPDSVYTDALQHRALVYKRVQNNLSSIKAALMHDLPVIFGTEVYASMMTREVARTGLVPDPTSSDTLEGGHCMLIVGADDTSRTGDFDVQNSWSTGWGNKGRCKMSYRYLLDRNNYPDFWVISLAS